MFLGHALRIFPKSHIGKIKQPLHLEVLRVLAEIFQKVHRCICGTRRSFVLRLGTQRDDTAHGAVGCYAILSFAPAHLRHPELLLQR